MWFGDAWAAAAAGVIPMESTLCYSLPGRTGSAGRNVVMSKNSKAEKDPTDGLPLLNRNAAGIDVGDEEHWVAVPSDRDTAPVRKFGTFTADLRLLVQWLRCCGITTVVMESTGVYWVALYDALEESGLDVQLVNARQVKQLPGRKSDIKDCQWLQTLHTFGLLNRCFRPAEDIRVLRSYMRQRERLVQAAGSCVQHMQQALTEMNIRLDNVISDITGLSGMRILRAIVAGERCPAKLAAMRHERIQASLEEIEKSLEGHWRQEQLFILGQALSLFDVYQEQLTECEKQIQQHLASFETRQDPDEEDNPPKQSGRKRSAATQNEVEARKQLRRVTAVDLTRIPGINVVTAEVVISEIGLDMTRWKSEKHVASFLGLCPNHHISGGKVLKRGTRKVKNRAATALRMAAQSLRRSQTALGAKFRRLRGKLGAPKATTAMAHTLVRLICRMLQYGQEYVEMGMQAYENNYRQQRLKWLAKEAKALNMVITAVKSTV